jgi:hypothetical protein
MHECSASWRVPVLITFIIASSEDLTLQKDKVLAAFEKMKSFITTERHDDFMLEIWDDEVLLQKEKELGIRVDW